MPYMLTAFLGLWAIREKYLGQESIYVCGMKLCRCQQDEYVYSPHFPVVYEMKYTSIWLIRFAFLVVLAAREIKRSIRQTEELAWSLS